MKKLNVPKFKRQQKVICVETDKRKLTKEISVNLGGKCTKCNEIIWCPAIAVINPTESGNTPAMLTSFAQCQKCGRTVDIFSQVYI